MKKRVPRFSTALEQPHHTSQIYLAWQVYRVAHTHSGGKQIDSWQLVIGDRHKLKHSAWNSVLESFVIELALVLQMAGAYRRIPIAHIYE